MEPLKIELRNNTEKEMYTFLAELNIAVRAKQARIEDKISPQLKEARELMRKDPYYSLFNISSHSFHTKKQEWNSFLGQKLEKLIGIIFRPYIPKEIPEGFKLPRNKQLCDYTVIFNGKKCAIEIKNRWGTAESKSINEYLRLYDEIKKIDNGEWNPIVLIRLTDNIPSAIRRWSKKGWKIYEGEDMNNFIKKYTNFDFNDFLDRITLPKLPRQGNLEEYIIEQNSETDNKEST